MSGGEGRLTGKVAIITGGSVGTGPDIAKFFVQEGARVLISARREALVLAAAEAAGPGAIGMKADVSREEDVQAMVDRAMTEYGQVDILLNNASVPGQDKYIAEQTLENWDSTIAVVLTSAMLCTREVLNRSMLARKTGSIVNFSSTASWMGMPRKSHYNAAKGALRAFTMSVANEVGPFGIRCNCIVPGGIETDNLKAWGRRMAAEQGIDYEEWYKERVKDMPLRTFSTTQDGANLALFLASDQSRTITGQSINIDSGSVMIG